MGDLKYVLFGAAVVLGIPAMAGFAMSSARNRGWILTLLIVSTGIGKNTSINICSMEEYRGPDRGFEFQLADLIALSLAVAAVVKFPRRIAWLPFNSILLAAYFGVCVVSLVEAPGTIYGLFSLWTLLRAYFIYWSVVNTIRVGTPLEGAWRGFVIEAVVMTVWTVFQKYVQGFYRVPGPFDHSNTIPLYVNLFMPAVAIWGLCDRGASRARTSLTLLGALGLLAAVAFTFSRAGTLLALMALLGALTISNVTSRSSRTVAISVLVGVGLLAGVIRALPSFLERMENAPESSEHARQEFNEAAQMMARDRTFGVGLNNFSLVLTYDERYRANIVVMANEEHAGVCHHIYNLTAAELGYTGLAAFVLVMAAFTLRALSTALRYKGLEAQLCWGFLLGLCCVHVSGMLEWCFRLSVVTDMCAICCGLMVGIGDRLAFEQRALETKGATR